VKGIPSPFFLVPKENEELENITGFRMALFN